MSKKFKRQRWWKSDRINGKNGWRKPRGNKNPIRKKKRGVLPTPEVGYRSPRSERGLHPSGLKDVLVHNPKELEGLNLEEHIVRIAGRVGERKRKIIIDKAKEKGLQVIGVEKSKENGS